LKRTLMVVGGSLETVPGISIAKDMNLHVVCSDINPEAAGMLAADDRIIVSSYDVDGSIAAAINYHNDVRPIHAVICIATDVPYTVASVANALNIPGISLDSAALSMNKLKMKDKFASDKVPIPWYKKVISCSHLKEIVTARNYPLIIKPIDSRGARGVLRLTEDVDLAWAFSISMDNSPSGEVMVEQYLSGPQVSTESILFGGRVYTLGFSDRNYEYLERYSPYIVENGGELPSFLSKKVQQDICKLIEKAAFSIGITDGVVKGDIVVHEGKPYIIELAARLSGGYFCTHLIPLNTGVNFVEQAIKLALGEKVNPVALKPRFSRGVGQRYFFPEPGIITSISGVEDVRCRPEIALCEIRVKVGDIIKPIENHPGRAGVVIATAENRNEAIAMAVDAVNTIKIKTEKAS
jgi:biotin carboxylase